MRHTPSGLLPLLVAQLCERTGFYAVTAAGAVYMTEQLGLSPAAAATQLGVFLALTYVAPLLGGWLADCRLGERGAAVIGSGLGACGASLLAVPHPDLVMIGLGLLVAGQGLFKPSLAVLINSPIDQQGARLQRESASRRSYFTVNAAAVMAPIGVSVLRSHAGWPWVFMASAALLVLPVAALVFSRGPAAGTAARTADRAKAPPPSQANNVRASLYAVLGVSALFGLALAQTATTLPLWLRSFADLRVPGSRSMQIDPILSASACSLFVLILTAPVERALRALRRRGQEPSQHTKLAASVFCIAASFTCLACVATRVRPSALTWPLAAIVVLTLGEILWAPVAQSLLVESAPPSQRGRYIGLWCCALGIGNLGAGVVGLAWSAVSPAAYFAALGLLSLIGLALFKR